MAYLTHILILISIYSILAVTLNLVLGYTGMLSVAQASFFGIGAYTTGILTTEYGVGFFSSLLCGIALAAILAFFIGIVLGRFRGDFLALVSIGFTIIVWSAFLNLSSLTRGPLGISGIPRPEIFSFKFYDNSSFLLLAVLLAAIVFVLIKLVADSSFGRTLKAIREDEDALRIFGYKAEHFKLAAFVISAGLGAVAGALYSSYISFIDPSSFEITESVFILSMTILGGLGKVQGSLLGAALLIIMPEAFRFIGFNADVAAQMRELFYGLLLIFLMMKRSQGLLGEYKL